MVGMVVAVDRGIESVAKSPIHLAHQPSPITRERSL